MPKDNFTLTATNENTIPIYSNGIGDKALYGYTNISRVDEDAITISARGTIGYIALRQAPFFPIVRLIVVIPKTEIILLKYFKYILENTEIQKSGGTIPQLTVPMLKDIAIPLPLMEEQRRIVSEIELLEQKIAECEAIMQGCAAKKQAVLQRYL